MKPKYNKGVDVDYSQYKVLEFRRKFLKFFGAEINITDPASQNVVGYIKMKAWKLREDVRIYTDKTAQQEVVHIHARQIIDLGATYDVFAGGSDQLLFSLKRKGLKSTFVRDHWDILDSNGAVTGSVQETSSTLALVRRWLGIIPFLGLLDLVFVFVKQTYEVTTAQPTGTPALAANIIHQRNPFIVKMVLDTSQAQTTVDPRINLAATAMLSIIEAAKN